MMKIAGIEMKNGIYITLIFLLALCIRLFNIFEVGLSHWDSGYYVGTALWLIGQGGTPYPWEPPIYSAFVSMGFLLLGIYDWVAILISGIFGSLTVILVYFMGKELFDSRTGLVASLFLSINQLHIIYSRMALTDSVFTFFFVLSLLLFLYSFRRGKIGYYILYGISLGVTQNVKYHGFMAFIVPAIFLAVYYAYVKSGRKRAGIRFRTTLTGMAISLLIMIIMHIPWVFAMGLGDYARETGSLTMESVVTNMGAGDYAPILSRGIGLYSDIFFKNKAEAIFQPKDMLFYPYLIFFWISPALVFCFLVSFAVRVSRGMSFVMIWFMFFLVFFSLGYKAGRVFLPAIPAFSLLSAAGAMRISDVLKMNILRRYRKDQVLCIVLAAVLLISVPSVAAAASNVHDGYRQAGTFLKENAGKGQYIFTTGGPQIRFYYPDGSWWKFCDNVSSSEISYVVTDNNMYRYPAEYKQSLMEMKNATKPVAVFYNGVLEIETVEDLRDMTIAGFYSIEIYRIGDDERKYVSFLDEYRKGLCTVY